MSAWFLDSKLSTCFDKICSARFLCDDMSSNITVNTTVINPLRTESHNYMHHQSMKFDTCKQFTMTLLSLA